MQILYDLAMALVGIPYLWGGKVPDEGLDCSGCVSILLHAYGLDIGVSTAQQIHDHFSKPDNHGSNAIQLGSLLFYGPTPQSIHHVGMALSPSHMIESGGGNSLVINREAAIRSNAYVKVVPAYVKGLQGVYLPHYAELTYP